MAVNFATDLQTSWIAWLAVLIIALGAAAATVRLDQREPDGGPKGGTSTTSSSALGDSSQTSGLLLRTTELERPDGSKMKTAEFFSEELAMQAFREDFEPGDP